MRRFTIDDDAATISVAVAPKANIVLLGLKNGGFSSYSLTDGKKLETVDFQQNPPGIPVLLSGR